MISDSEFLAGGFPSNFGGRLSSVLNITAREGDSKNGRLSDSKGRVINFNNTLIIMTTNYHIYYSNFVKNVLVRFS